MKIERLDHLVLTVRDLDASCAFYRDVLGMEVVDSGPAQPRAVRFGAQKINLHQAGREFEPKSERPTPGSGDLCLVTATDVAAVADQLRARGVEVLLGPVGRSGALGPITSVYFRDPDGNLVEVCNYPAGQGT